jgi:hypothetical protein
MIVRTRQNIRILFLFWWLIWLLKEITLLLFMLTRTLSRVVQVRRWDSS